MSSKRTWERRALSGILQRSQGLGVDVIEGLTIEEDGTFVFMLEELSEVEALRVIGSVDAVKARLDSLLARMKPKDGQVDTDEDGDEGEDAIDAAVAAEEGEAGLSQAEYETQIAAAGLAIPADDTEVTLAVVPPTDEAPVVEAATETAVVASLEVSEPAEAEEFPEEDVEPDEGPAAFMEGAPEPAVVPLPAALAYVHSVAAQK